MRQKHVNTPALMLAAALAASTLCGFADAVKDREGSVRNDKATMENDARWIYNDIDRGFERARSEKKPLLVVLRCVPCLACAGIDASVLQEPALAPLLDQFVCVRVINGNALDLSLFQFDYDLSFSTLFFNGDRTVYGRYGSWTHQKHPQDKTVAGYKSALEAALAIHRGYPANKDALAGKQGAATPYRRPIEVPGLEGKYKLDLDWRGRVVPSCVHCHQIGDAFRASYRDQNKPVPLEWIYPQPAPETIGLSLAPDHAAQVASVTAGSPAARAGLQPGDEMVALAGQPLVSIADVSWILHRATDTTALAGVVQRQGKRQAFTIELPQGWRQHTDISGRVGTWQMRGFATGGLLLEDLPDADRAERHLGTNEMALLVKHVGEYGKHAAAKKAGFRKGDVMISAAGVSRRVSEGELIGYLLQQHRAGETVKTTVLRDAAKVELPLPMQ